MDILSSLNSNQKKAVEAEGTVIVIAGPGTGKTKTLTTKIEHIINDKNISPREILALTFTQKAAAEMKERLSHLRESPNISTFHALAFEILNKSNISVEIISETGRLEILEELDENKKEIKDLSLFISQYKNNLSNKGMPAIVERYNQLLRKKGCIDYDDLLIQLYELLKNNDKNIANYKKRFSYILVDEFQDTNNLQYELLKLLLKNNNLFVIGDPYQSIYSFRGADNEILKNLKKDFLGFSEITLDINYRSIQPIINASASLFPYIPLLQSISEKNGEVALIKTNNEYTEAEYVVEMINKKIGGTDLLKAGEIQEEKRETNFSDFAVLYRTHSMNRILEQKFIDSGIPYQAIGGKTLYEQSEIVFIINFLEYLSSKDYRYLKNIFISPLLNLSNQSKKILIKVLEKEMENNISVLTIDTSHFLSSIKDIQTISTFISELENIVNTSKNTNLLQLIHMIIESIFLKEYLLNHKTRVQRVQSFVSTMTQFNDKKDSLAKCVEYLRYLKDHEFYDPNADKVTLLTLHASKGLEFKHVFICGFEDGVIPLKRNGIDIEEEKRLLYVGMTRAKENLYLLQTKQRNKKNTIISPFHMLIQRDILEKDDEKMVYREKQIKKWKEKKSQLQLF